MELLLIIVGFGLLLIVMSTTPNHTSVPIMVTHRPQNGCAPMLAFLLGAGFMFTVFVLAALGR